MVGHCKMSVVPRPSLVSGPFVAVTAATAAFFVYVGMLIPLLPTFIEDELGGGELGVGLSLAVFALAAVAARPLVAVVTQRYGRRLPMVVGALVAAAAGAATGLADSLPVLLALRAVAGVGEAALFVAAATLVADLAPPTRRAEAASYFSVAVFAGLGVGPIIGESVVDGGRYELAFLVAALAAVVAAVLALAVPSNSTTAGTTVRRRPRLLHPAALAPGLVLASGIAALAAFLAFLPEHARAIGLAGSGALFLTYSVVCLVLRLAGARLPERLGARRSVTIALSSTASGLTLLAAVAQPWALWVAAVLVGTGQAFLYPSLMATTVDRVDEHDRAVALGSFTMFFDLGTMAGGLALGSVADVFGKRSAFAGGVLVALAGLWLLRTRVAPATSPQRAITRETPIFVPVAGD